MVLETLGELRPPLNIAPTVVAGMVAQEFQVSGWGGE